MKKSFLILCLGIMIGSLGSMSSGALAAVGDKIEATISKYVFVVNGEEKQIDVAPLTINGTSYLPVRALSNLLGYDVTYKAESSIEGVGQIELSKTMESLVEETEYVLDREEATPMDEVMGPEEIKAEIEKIEDMIDRSNDSVRLYEGFKKNERNSDGLNENIQKTIDDLKAKITELEAQKAELQAQLNQTEEVAE